VSTLRFSKLALFATTVLVSSGAAWAQDDAALEEGAREPGLRLDPGVSIDEIIVRGEYIPEPQRATSQVASFLSSEDLARTGDDNAALALTRLSGLSVVGGRFAYVRGLGDRYSAARLNGSPLPSPEPLRRTVPLDIFPSNILEGALVQKTYSPNYPGEFGGGIIDLTTLSGPTETFANFTAGVGVNTATTFRNGLRVDGGDFDIFGYDDGTRNLPREVAAAINTDGGINGLRFSDPAALEAAGESLTNEPLTAIRRESIAPDFNFLAEGGRSFEFDDKTLSLVAVAAFDNSWSIRRATQTRVTGAEIAQDFEVDSTRLISTLNTLGSASVNWDSHEIKALGLYIHSTDHETQINDGIDENFSTSVNFDGRLNRQTNGWYARSLRMFQASGSHFVRDFTVDWRGSYSASGRKAPYERGITRAFDDATGLLRYDQNNAHTVRFADLNDDLYSGGLDLTYDAPLSGARTAAFTVGYEYSTTDRSFDVTELRFRGDGEVILSLEEQFLPPELLFAPENIGPTGFELEDATSNFSSYTAGLDIHSTFFMADMELIPTLRTTLGVRYEDARQDVETFGLVNGEFQNDDRDDASLKNDYFLPSALVTWNFAENMQFRVGYSQTIARPQFRELARSIYVDQDNDRTYRGNPGLVDTEFENYDARFEYYIGRDQFLTVAGFYKKLDRPIEEFLASQSSRLFETTYINAPRALLYGGEFEYRTRFVLPLDQEWFQIRDWLFSINYTYTYTEVQADADDQIFEPSRGEFVPASNFDIDGRQLQGAPEHILNAQLGWESEYDQFTVLAGWVDDRLSIRGNTFGETFPDVIEDPGVQLDVVYRRNFNVFQNDFTFGLSFRNILATRHQEFQISDLGRTEFNTYERGRDFSASITARF